MRAFVRLREMAPDAKGRPRRPPTDRGHPSSYDA
jgi:hypothetical protein